MSSRGRVLLITPRFFGYEEDIARQFRQRGFEVDLVDERPSNSPLMKAVFRVRAKTLAASVNRYYRGLLQSRIRGTYDLVLVIKGEVVPEWFLEAVRRASPNAAFVFYSFDSVANSSNFAALVRHFDHLYCFQPVDPAIDPRFLVKELFYVPDFSPLGTAAPRRYEIAFIGTLHSDRYRFVKRVISAFSATFTHFYVQAPWYLAVRGLVDRRFRAVDRADVRFDKLGRDRVAEVFRNSLAVLDMQHEDQLGLTMRTFEVIASGAYLVTTNRFVHSTPIMQTGRVIVTAADPSDEEFEALVARIRECRPQPDMPAGFERYSLAVWVDEFIGLLPGGMPA